MRYKVEINSCGYWELLGRVDIVDGHVTCVYPLNASCGYELTDNLIGKSFDYMYSIWPLTSIEEDSMLKVIHTPEVITRNYRFTRDSDGNWSQHRSLSSMAIASPAFTELLDSILEKEEK